MLLNTSCNCTAFTYWVTHPLMYYARLSSMATSKLTSPTSTMDISRWTQRLLMSELSGDTTGRRCLSCDSQTPVTKPNTASTGSEYHHCPVAGNTVWSNMAREFTQWWRWFANCCYTALTSPYSLCTRLIHSTAIIRPTVCVACWLTR